jgi:alpha-N-arabinofuranosidase
MSTVTPIPFVLVICLFTWHPRPAAQTIRIDPGAEAISVNPLLYGQFIEHLGRSIDGGIYEEGNPLSDDRGFRTDVLQLVKDLDVPLLRFPGGTVTKIYHWEHGIGPKDTRPKRPNLIWGGNINYRFGTAEFIEYCREIGAEPFLVVNMATGTPEEASNWVEYCNGTGDTHYANLRRKHGYPEPFNVRYWGIGNEESARADAGRHYEVEDYIADTWQFAKLMKLQDRSLKLVLVGDTRDPEWNERVLDELHPITDYLAVHFYAVPGDTTYTELLESVYQYEAYLATLRGQLATLPETGGLSRWYRFEGRQQPVKLAVDEWGIWHMDSPKGKGAYRLEYPYEWRHALATGAFLHLFYRNSDIIGLATWAQLTNVLAPIMTTSDTAYIQPPYVALRRYREHMLNNYLPLTESRKNGIDMVATVSDTGDRVVVAVVNTGVEPVTPDFAVAGMQLVRREIFGGGAQVQADDQPGMSLGFYFFE